MLAHSATGLMDYLRPRPEQLITVNHKANKSFLYGRTSKG